MKLVTKFKVCTILVVVATVVGSVPLPPKLVEEQGSSSTSSLSQMEAFAERLKGVLPLYHQEKVTISLPEGHGDRIWPLETRTKEMIEHIFDPDFFGERMTRFRREVEVFKSMKDLSASELDRIRRVEAMVHFFDRNREELLKVKLESGGRWDDFRKSPTYLDWCLHRLEAKFKGDRELFNDFQKSVFVEVEMRSHDGQTVRKYLNPTSHTPIFDLNKD
ncbi:hypothetical protein IE53DRAFT_382213 [Violaceomyces palustris]|uniref:Uncharacterized protein n=1 Tax=Violaceomyces palustris TaxID=1673888 RepID=A0ACD0NNF1_9BASI|nr:hypothetical protein IE53DRAFT_382213 [Violaceomyces palustris]